MHLDSYRGAGPGADGSCGRRSRLVGRGGRRRAHRDAADAVSAWPRPAKPNPDLHRRSGRLRRGRKQGVISGCRRTDADVARHLDRPPAAAGIDATAGSADLVAFAAAWSRHDDDDRRRKQGDRVPRDATGAGPRVLRRHPGAARPVRRASRSRWTPVERSAHREHHDFTPHPFTALGWEVRNIQETVEALALGGVTFQRYPGSAGRGGVAVPERAGWPGPTGTGTPLSLSQLEAGST